MQSITKVVLGLLMIGGLCACGNQPQKTALNMTLIQPLPITRRCM